MKISEKLKKRLVAIGYQDARKLERCYSGKYQRQSGAWSWSFYNYGNSYGSAWNMKECLEVTDEDLKNMIES